MKTVDEPYLFELPVVSDLRGKLSFAQSGILPFDIERVYWVYDIPGGIPHAGRALRTTAEILVALSGSFSVETIDAAGRRRTFSLNRSYRALMLPPMTWRCLSDFSTNAVAMVMASAVYNPADYIRSFELFNKESLR